MPGPRRGKRGSLAEPAKGGEARSQQSQRRGSRVDRHRIGGAPTEQPLKYGKKKRMLAFGEKNGRGLWLSASIAWVLLGCAPRKSGPQGEGMEGNGMGLVTFADSQNAHRQGRHAGRRLRGSPTADGGPRAPPTGPLSFGSAKGDHKTLMLSKLNSREGQNGERSKCNSHKKKKKGAPKVQTPCDYNPKGNAGNGTFHYLREGDKRWAPRPMAVKIPPWRGAGPKIARKPRVSKAIPKEEGAGQSSRVTVPQWPYLRHHFVGIAPRAGKGGRTDTGKRMRHDPKRWGSVKRTGE